MANVSGPGALVAVVGPSGAGKDTLIALAQRIIGDHPAVVFPRRIVTRESAAAEEHDSVSPEEFDRGLGQGAFAFWWDAHGHRYGLPVAVDHHIGFGRTVVCNVSRAVVPGLRRRYERCTVVMIDAPREIRRARILARSRATDGTPEARLDRASLANDALAPDLVIDNSGAAHVGGLMLAALVLDLTPRRAQHEPQMSG